MDNLCHSLVGAALAATGLRRRTALATATMVIGANFPDIDVVYAFSPTALAVRRGITHGLPAHVVLPFLLTGLVLAWDRWVRRRRDPSLEPARPAGVLLVAALSIWTHTLLDHMNSYGVRWLMPMSGRWYYGDALFIVDPWMWLLLGAAVWWAARLRRRGAEPAGERRARWLGGAVTTYVAAMALGGVHGRSIVRRELAALGVPRDAHLMVAPMLANPFRRDVVFRASDGAYRTGRLTLPGSRVSVDSTAVPAAHADDPAVRAALAVSRQARAFWQWSRFPYAEVTRDAAGTTVRLDDLRYARPGRSRSFAYVEVRLPADVPYIHEHASVTLRRSHP